MFDRFTENSKQLMSRSRLAAARAGHQAIEPLHMLIAMLELPGCNALSLLRELDVDTATLAASFEMLTQATSPPPAQLPFAPAARRVLEAALAFAAERGDNHVGSQHLLVAMVTDGDNDAAQILVRLGVDAELLTAAQARLAGGSGADPRRLLLISNSTMHGGGYLEHCAHEIADFLDAGQRVMFVPYALHDHAAYAAKARAAFGALGHELVSVHEHKHSPGAIADGDAVFVGGGNTFRLLNALYHYGLFEAIRDRALAGMPYIGSSAGTNVATLSIRTTNDMPIVQPPSFTALQLVPFQINPHYLDPDPQSRHMGETREERLRQFHEEHSVPVLGLREGCLLRVAGRRMQLRGTTAARLFRRGAEPEEFPPPCDLSFLLED